MSLEEIIPMRVVWICIILGIYVALMSMVGYYSCYSKKWY